MAECYDCGLDYGCIGWIEAIIPDNVWNFISPTGDGGGILCINCISQRLAERGLSRIPIWFCETESIKAQCEEPSLEIQRNWGYKIIHEKKRKELPIPTTPWHDGT